MKRRLLSDQEVSAYHANGYVTPRYRLPTDILAELRRSVEALIDANADVFRSRRADLSCESSNS